ERHSDRQGPGPLEAGDDGLSIRHERPRQAEGRLHPDPEREVARRDQPDLRALERSRGRGGKREPQRLPGRWAADGLPRAQSVVILTRGDMNVSVLQKPVPFRRAAGFTVVELAVSLLVMAVVTLGMLALFDFSNRLSNVQTNVAEMQQSQRIAQQDVIRMVRMAARGPLPLGLPPVGMTLSVWSQVPVGTRIGGPGTPEVLEGTDILTVRGVFGSPVYQVNSSRPNAFAVQTVD